MDEVRRAGCIGVQNWTVLRDGYKPTRHQIRLKPQAQHTIHVYALNARALRYLQKRSPVIHRKVGGQLARASRNDATWKRGYGRRGK